MVHPCSYFQAPLPVPRATFLPRGPHLFFTSPPMGRLPFKVSPPAGRSNEPKTRRALHLAITAAREEKQIPKKNTEKNLDPILA